MFKTKVVNKTFEESFKTAKSFFYLKSMQLKCGFHRYNEHYRLYHPSFWDVDRNKTKYLRENRDYKTKNLPIQSMDPLHFDHQLEKIDGGLPIMISNLKKKNFLGNTSTALISPYKVITLLYNMVKRNIKDPEFYTEVERTLNTNLIKEGSLHPRYAYGYLYCSYMTNIFRPENIIFFENYLEGRQHSFSAVWVVELIDAFTKSKGYSLEKLKLLLGFIYEDSLIIHWEKQIKHNQKIMAMLAASLQRGKCFNEKLWGKLIEDIKVKPSKHLLPDYILILNAVNFYYNDPESPKYKDPEILEVLDKLKSQNQEINDAYLYNANELRFYTFEELKSRNNEISSKTHFMRTPMVEEEEVEVEEEEDIEEYDEAPIFEELKRRVEVEGQSLEEATKKMLEKYGSDHEFLLEELCFEYYPEYTQHIATVLIKSNKFDELFQKKADPKIGFEPKPQGAAGGAAGSAKGNDDVKHKKKK